MKAKHPLIGNAAAVLDGASLGYIDFGCGTGQSTAFAASAVSGEGLGIDIAQGAVDACLAKGFNTERGDLLTFQIKNAALATFAINVVPELPGRSSFEHGLANIIGAARNFTLIQHSFYDMDASLAARGLQVAANHGKKILFKPTLADYLPFAKRHGEALNLSGVAVFTTGRAEVVPLTLDDVAGDISASSVSDVTLPRTLRVVFGRKDAGRFRTALETLGAGRALFMWERG